MSTPDQPSTPPLTRRQLREMRNTGVTPVVDDDKGDASADGSGEEKATEHPSGAPLARPAEPARVAPAPVKDADVDLGSKPLTRRQARQQERIRTASVPVITPEGVPTTGSASSDGPEAPRDSGGHGVARSGRAPQPAPSPWADPQQHAATAPARGVATGTIVAAPDEQSADEATEAEEAVSDEAAPVGGADRAVEAADVEPEHVEPEHTEPVAEKPVAEKPVAETPVAEVPEPAAEEPEPAAEEPEPTTPDDAEAVASKQSEQGAAFGLLADLTTPGEDEERTVINPRFGAGVVAGDGAPLAATDFDDLLSRASSSSGSATAPSTLIMSHTSVSPLVAPIAGTGEVLVTGTFALPEGLGSLGHARGTADGREADAILMDGEIPATSSPTPIAASAAVSTIKSHEDIIHPPAPEKGGRLMVTLAITAGVLALALVGVLVFALVTGVIS